MQRLSLGLQLPFFKKKLCFVPGHAHIQLILVMSQEVTGSHRN